MILPLRGRSVPFQVHQAAPNQEEDTPMAKSQIKAGGPTRGRRRVRKIGMGSGKYHAAKKANRKP